MYQVPVYHERIHAGAIIIEEYVNSGYPWISFYETYLGSVVKPVDALPVSIRQVH
jgi:hypothetical protein